MDFDESEIWPAKYRNQVKVLSENSFKHTTDMLKLYADISGLKVNFGKTKAVLLGSRKYCRVKYSSKYRIV